MDDYFLEVFDGKYNCFPSNLICSPEDLKWVHKNHIIVSETWNVVFKFNEDELEKFNRMLINEKFRII